jgi:predicted transcriptional regulator
MVKQKILKPTESELEILAILWAKKSATVRDVHEELLHSKDAGYTTTLKLMQIMYEKTLVTRDDTNKTHIYKAGVSREKTQKQFLNKMINSLFSGSSTELVLQALGNKNATEEDLEKINSLIQELKNKK